MNRIACLFLWMALGSVAFSQETVTKEQVDDLVARLVSANEVPDVRYGEAAYPKGYDREAARDVIAAFRELCDLGPPAFPFLFDRFSDERYATTQDVGPADANFSVGELCLLVVDMQLQPCKQWTRGDGDPRFRPFRPHYVSRFKLDDLYFARGWWRTRKNKSLRELQIEVLEWIQTEEARREADFEQVERDWIAQLLTDLKATDSPMERGWPWVK